MSHNSLIKYVRTATAVMALSLVLSSYSIAASDLFLKLDSIAGESVDSKHKSEIDILAWSWGMTLPGDAISGTGKPVIQDLSITKYVDSASPLLASRCASGQHIATALLTVRKPGATPVEYIKLALTDVIVTSVSAGGSGAEDKMTEKVSLNFRAYKYDYYPVKSDGSVGTVVTTGYDRGTGTISKRDIQQQNTIPVSGTASSLTSLLAWSAIK